MANWREFISSPRFYVPLLTVAVLGGVSTWYYRVSLERSESAANDRSFRILAALADQFSSQIRTYRDMESKMYILENTELGEEIKQNAALDPKECDDASGFNAVDSLDQVLIPVKLQGQGEAYNCYGVPLSTVMKPLEDSLPDTVFEDLILATGDGRVLYQTNRSALRISNLKPIFEGIERPGLEAGKQKSKQGSKVAPDVVDPLVERFKRTLREMWKPEDKTAETLAYSRLSEVVVAGEPYRLYTVPVPLPVREASRTTVSRRSPPAVGASGTGAAPPGDGVETTKKSQLAIGGVLHQKAFRRARSKPLANTIVTIGFLLALGFFTVYPVLRFAFIADRELLGKWTGFAYGFQLVLACFLIAGLIGHLAFLKTLAGTDTELNRLATQLETNLVDETRVALRQLQDLEKSLVRDPRFDALGPIAGLTDCSVLPDTSAETQLKSRGDRDIWSANSLLPDPADKHAFQISQPDYPYFDLAYWVDDAGVQRAKISARRSVTPRLRLCTGDEGWTHVVGADLWKDRRREFQSDGFFIDTGYASTSGRYLAFFSRPASPEAAGHHIRMAVLGTALVSLAAPVFPPEYGFAVVDQKGKVLYHSTPAKNGRENFANACGRAQRVLDLLETRERGTLETAYLGVDHRVLVRPVDSFEGCPWSIVVFRDLTNSESDHFDVMILFIALAVWWLALMSLLLVAGIGLVRLSNRASAPTGIRSGAARFLWPVNSERRHYFHIASVLVLVAAGQFAVLLPSTQTQLLWVAFAVPVSVCAAIWLKLSHRESWISALALALWLISNVAFGASAPASTHVPRTFAGLGQPGYYVSLQSFGWMTWICASISLLAIRLKAAKPEPPHQSLTTLSEVAGADATLERSPFLQGLREWLAATTVSAWRAVPTMALYASWATAFLICIALLPAVQLFNSAAEFELEVAARRNVLDLADSLDDRETGILTDYGRDGWKTTGRQAFLMERRHSRWDRYDLGATIEVAGAGGPVEHELQPLLLYLATSLERSHGESPHNVGLRKNVDSGLRTWRRDGDARLLLTVGKNLEVRGRPLEHRDALMHRLAGDQHPHRVDWPFPHIRDIKRAEDPVAIFWRTVALLLLIGGMFLGIFFSLSRLFAIHVWRVKAWTAMTAADILNEKYCLAVVGDPDSGKSAAFRDLQNIRYIDLAGEDFPLVPSISGAIVLDHFERLLYGRGRDGIQGPELLERLVLHHDARVVIVSTIDPLYYLEQLSQSSPGDNIDLERWTRVLARFQVMAWSHPSRLIGDARWRLVWNTCSAEEQRALYHLALSGLPNYRQRHALAHLMARGLVVRDRRYAIFDQEFQRYILRAVSEHELAFETQAGAGDALAAIRMGLIAAAAVLVIALVWVSGEQTLAYLTTGATAVTAVGRLIAGSKGRNLPLEPEV